ncbi:MAG TPA: acyl-CoA dehydratase activase [Candidatus Limnocylindria bacterium]|nr:acyl-CoA dehydratase activase [Candidatus Limnocylindria bacterium]
MGGLIAGIDMGARSAKAVVIDQDGTFLGSGLARMRPDFDGLANDVLGTALARAGASRGDVGYVATTGLGRYNVGFRDIQITEITAVARGATHLFPGSRCVLDIGAQSTRAVRVLESGQVKEFRTNDKCAAGAGGFAERAARYLEVTLDDLGPLSLEAKAPPAISSVCAVFAESEIINLVTAGHQVPDIVRGIHDSLAQRGQQLLKRVGIEPEVTFVGGMARQAGMRAALEAALGLPVNVAAEPDLVAALGAALLGRQRLARLAREEGRAAA